jgi:hypothetical protein
MMMRPPGPARFVEQAFGREMHHQWQEDLGSCGEVKEVIAPDIFGAIYLVKHRMQLLPSGRGLEI